MLRQSNPLRVKAAAQPRTTKASGTPPLSLLTAARRGAIRELARAPACSCCDSLLQHILRCLGSTFFYDDDPNLLWKALEPTERSLITPRVLAACIVLSGRERQELYPTQSPDTWPALHLLCEGGDPAAADELLASIQQLIASAQQRSALNPDDRLRGALAYLWAAVDSLQGPSQ